MKVLFDYLSLFRVRQWVKNSFIFMPLVFAGRLFNARDAFAVMLVFIDFCVLTSAIYVLNDILDAGRDRLHPKKKDRPIASGRIQVRHALPVMAALLALSLAGAFLIDKSVLVVAVLYVILHIIYNFISKNKVILDVISIALGFELRVWAGCVVLGVIPSTWLQLCIFLLALFLGFIKRRHEKTFLYEKAAEHRGVLCHYTPYFLDQMIMISATLFIVFYGLYVMTVERGDKSTNFYMSYTIIFVVYAMFRYLYLVHVKNKGSDAGEILTTDVPFMVNMILWLLSVVFMLYLK